jgi:hypothetical protein
VLSHFGTTVRSFYTSLAKAIHTPLRRREDAALISPAMRSTSLYIGLILKMSCEGVGAKQWEKPTAAGSQQVGCGSSLVHPWSLVSQSSRLFIICSGGS